MILSRPDHDDLLIRLLERQRQMAEDFIQFLLDHPIRGLNDSSRLPYPKDDLIEAFANQIANCPDKQVAEDFLSCMAKLAWFQEGVREDHMAAQALDATSAEKLSESEFLAYASTVHEMTLLMRKQSEDTQNILRLYAEAIAANPRLCSPRNGRWDWLPFRKRGSQDEAEAVLLGLENRKLEVLPRVPESGSMPDVEDEEPFFEAEVGAYDVAAYRDILPIGVREGGKPVIKYPLVLAATDCFDDPVFFVAVEVGEMFGTCNLCAFDGEGRHLNFGPWDLDDASEKFLERALAIVRPHLKALRTR